MTRLVLAVWLPARSHSELFDGWSPQDFLAERMITMVIDLRSQVVKFIFCGRNSGQSTEEERRRKFLKVAGSPTAL
jgi:hypothetical protein